ncbi:MAG: ROK family protein [Candidatus Neomarinimicrobiota bacterium]|nr:MAG: ROK family protein [Candidatus Neomarinimicrobiota bacterium]
MPVTIGIDLGGTKIEAVRLDPEGRVEFLKRIPTRREEGYEAICDRLVNLIRECSEGHEQPPVGVGTPGALSHRTGLIKNSNTVCLIGRPLKEDLERRLGQSIRLENDANCFGLAEAVLGAGRGHSLVFGVILGTGVGGGIILNGSILRGRTWGAGEWGHAILIPDGHSCYCGRRGCVETYLSGPALERDWTRRTGQQCSLETIVREQVSHPDFRGWKTDFLRHFGLGLGNVINILDPDVVVLGGGVSNIDWLYTEGVRAVHTNCFTDVPETPLLPNQLGDSAGVLGAALLARELL